MGFLIFEILQLTKKSRAPDIPAVLQFAAKRLVRRTTHKEAIEFAVAVPTHAKQSVM